MASHTPDLLQSLEANGFTLSLAEGGLLYVQPASALTDDLRDLIRSHKAHLVAALERRAASSTPLDTPLPNIRPAPQHRPAFDVGQVWRDPAAAYHLHHFACAQCIAAAQGRGNRCTDGQALKARYDQAFVAANSNHPPKKASQP